MLRWLGRNLSTLLLAFILALVVWVSSVLSTDPNEESVLSRPLQLEIIGQDPALLQTNPIPSQVRLTLNAPRSIWEQLNSSQNYVRTWIDLSGLGKGEHVVQVRTQVALTPVQVIKVEPAEIVLNLELLTTRTFDVKVNVTGEPALGYRKGVELSDPVEVTISGPESLVSQVVEVRAGLDVRGASDTVRERVAVQAYDDKGEIVQNVTITPATILITQPVNLLGGYRNVVVKVITDGKVANGYWLTNVSVTPPNVTVFSSDPLLVNELPGYVETNPLDLNDLNDDTDIRATLNLPEGVTLAGEESVLVRLSIAALEGSLPISLPIEVIGLPPELYALVSPDTVDVLLTGPMPILNNLNAAGIRISINVSGMEPGVYQIAPVVDLLPGQVQVATILPENVEVTITTSPTPTPSTSAGTQPSAITVTPTQRP